jgi:hypothetical protein
VGAPLGNEAVYRSGISAGRGPSQRDRSEFWELLFNLITDRYELRTVVATTNLPFADRVTVFAGRGDEQDWLAAVLPLRHRLAGPRYPGSNPCLPANYLVQRLHLTFTTF